MKRTTLNFALDAIGLLNLLSLAATGSIMRWVLPPGSGGGQGRGFRGGRGPVEIRTLLGLGRHDWGDVHFVLALLFLSLILIHIVLHWTWIKTCTRSVLSPSRQSPCEPQDEHPVQ